MNLELSDKERDKLVSVLEYFIPELREEIASGVKHDWKVELKQEKQLLQDILERLKHLQ